MKDIAKVPSNIQAKISKWLNGKFFLYNNDYGNDFEAVMNGVL